MNRAVLRTLQAGVALAIIAAAGLVAMVLLGMQSRDEAMKSATDVGLLLVVGTGACCALIAVLGLNRDKDES